MAWSSLFRTAGPNTRYCWNYQFEWTRDHLELQDSLPLRQSFDSVGDDAYLRIKQIISQNRAGCKTAPKTSHNHKDLFLTLKENAGNDQIIGRLWTDVWAVPSWVDWAAIERGQHVFYRYGGANLTGLAFQSLLGGFGASRVVETLAKTGGLSVQNARRRLLETTQHLLEITMSLESIQPGGHGHESTIRVRLLHAAVRQRILDMVNRDSSYYDVDKLGIPINDLDCVGTISSFSSSLIWLALPRQGIFLSHQEQSDFIALFRYVAYLLGVPNEYFSSSRKAKAIMESLLYNEIKPTPTGRMLAQNMLTALEGQYPMYASKKFLEAQSRWLNGNELCNELGLGKPSAYYTALMCGQCMFFALFARLHLLPSFDRRKIATVKVIFWKMIVENEKGLQRRTQFAVKEVQNHTKDSKEEAFESGAGKSAAAYDSERRNLRRFLIGCASLGLGVLLLISILNTFKDIVRKLCSAQAA